MLPNIDWKHPMLTFLDYVACVNDHLERETVIEISCDGKQRKF